MPQPIELNDMEPEFKEARGEVPAANFDLCLTCGTCTADARRRNCSKWIPASWCACWCWGWTKRSKAPMGLGLHHVHALHQRLPHESRYPQTGLQHARQLAPGKAPQGDISGSCDQHIRTGNAMGVPTEDFIWTVEDVAEEIRADHPGFENLQATVDRKGPFMAINQNSREPVTEPDELGPLWKILHGGRRLDLSLGDVGRGKLLPVSGRR
jgi:hypothetical protein